ncbi:MAG: 5-formyltetrahydrofolate cyclo-ligase [Alphaproteobacteria bacterium]|nr:5-formyltetrahydrofolate cyclo-ligase [Alphaproteobacteria bacterium]
MRKEARRHRAFASPKPGDFDAAADLFFESLKPVLPHIIGAYWPKGREFDPMPVLERFHAQGGLCALPVMQGESRILKFAPWTPQTIMIEGPHHILQPATDEGAPWVEPDILIVPLLAFDRRGGRLGQGGGYYDATLAALRASKTIRAVGFAYAEQACLFNLPLEPHDQRLDWVITPEKAHSFG